MVRVHTTSSGYEVQQLLGRRKEDEEARTGETHLGSVCGHVAGNAPPGSEADQCSCSNVNRCSAEEMEIVQR